MAKSFAEENLFARRNILYNMFAACTRHTLLSEPRESQDKLLGLPLDLDGKALKLMPLMLTKIVTAIISPLGLSLFLALIAGILFWREWKKLGGILLSLAIAWLWLWSTPVFTDWVVGMIESEFPPVPVEEMESADAIVLLGGGVMSARPPRLYTEVNAAGDRVLHAARLYKAGKARWIIVSGGCGVWSDENLEPDSIITRALLKELGVPEEAVLTEDASRNTRENALFTKRLLDDHGFKKILLVTSALHMRRAIAEFQHVCPQVCPAPTDYEMAKSGPRMLLVFLPDAGALADGSKAFKEIIGCVVQMVTATLSVAS
ncbi:MAG: YdcF family protein [Candidatus Hydrogenedentes bacterium]|nr:YdcF family protein [Candidatus Hydrogenedentota bacterium]